MEMVKRNRFLLLPVIVSLFGLAMIIDGIRHWERIWTGFSYILNNPTSAQAYPIYFTTIVMLGGITFLTFKK